MQCISQGRWCKEAPVGHSVVDGANGGVSLVIQGAVWHSSHFQEGPDVSIAPVKDGVDSHERRPVSTARAECLLPICVGIPSAFGAARQNYRMHTSLCTTSTAGSSRALLVIVVSQQR